MKNILNYLFLFLIFALSSCERENYIFIETVSLRNNLENTLTLRFFEQGQITETEVFSKKDVLLYAGVGFEDIRLLDEYPNIYDSLYIITSDTTIMYYDTDNDSNACFLNNNPLCMENYEKTKKEEKEKRITELLITIQ